uniref:Uncharacterized protein n=1 Tax=Panagrolaimus sp. ES5 TaxID=591445 RepID=A0AC34F866_9BILA
MKNVAYENPKEVFECLQNENAFDILISHLESTSRKVSEQAIKILINLVAENSEICHYILDYEVLPHINNLLTRVFSIKLFVAKFITKVTRYPEQIDAVIAADILQNIFKFLNDGTEITEEIKIQSVKIVRNIVHFKQDYIQKLIEENIISKLAANFESQNVKLITLALFAMTEIIDSACYENIQNKLIRCGGIRKIQKLLEHENESIRKLSDYICNSCNGGEERRFYDEAEDNKRKISITGRSEAGTHENSKISDDERPIQIEFPQNSEKSKSASKRSSNIARENVVKRRITTRSVTYEPTDTEQFENSIDIDLSSNSDPCEQSNNIAITNGTQIDLKISSTSQSSAIPLLLSPLHQNDATQTNHNIGIDSDLQLLNIGFFLNDCCKTLGLQLNRKKFIEFYRIYQNIEFNQITFNSKPASHFEAIEKTGFGCLSTFFTGDEESGELIRKRLNDEIIEDMEVFDKEKVKKLTNSLTLIDEHIEMLVKWFNCCFLVFGNGICQKYGQRNADNTASAPPLFIMEKKEEGEKSSFAIVLSFKNQN